ncbi:MAG: sortase [Candidatus Paceibacterota bacterium]|jgi:LPXTG-site transpeptidase (sortase) family protein
MNHFHKNILLFVGVFLITLFSSVILLYVFGFIPSEFEVQTRDNTIASKIAEGTFQSLGLSGSSTVNFFTSQQKNTELPVRIVAPTIGLDSAIEIPTSTDFLVLDNSLDKGPVYYPGSGQAGVGNMFIFGHSTGFKVVINKAYQVFNNIKNLKNGDEIKIYGKNKVYTYKVSSVNLVNENEALVNFSNKSNMLTLSTCDSFGKKTDRYVVEAYFSY